MVWRSLDAWSRTLRISEKAPRPFWTSLDTGVRRAPGPSSPEHPLPKLVTPPRTPPHPLYTHPNPTSPEGGRERMEGGKRRGGEGERRERPQPHPPQYIQNGTHSGPGARRTPVSIDVQNGLGAFSEILNVRDHASRDLQTMKFYDPTRSRQWGGIYI